MRSWTVAKVIVQIPLLGPATGLAMLIYGAVRLAITAVPTPYEDR